jgi:molybdenum-dependent DNA-binding transcriptional regulator ModE
LEDSENEAAIEVAEGQADLVINEVETIAEKRWGARGRQFVQALMETGSVSEASAAASVSRQTAHKYLRELRKTLNN